MLQGVVAVLRSAPRGRRGRRAWRRPPAARRSRRAGSPRPRPARRPRRARGRGSAPPSSRPCTRAAGSPPTASTSVSGRVADRVPARGRIGEEDEAPGLDQHLLAVDREPRAPLQHHVELLVAAGLVALDVVLDQLVAGRGRRVGVQAEAAHVERMAQRMPASGRRRTAGRRRRCAGCGRPSRQPTAAASPTLGSGAPRLDRRLLLLLLRRGRRLLREPRGGQLAGAAARHGALHRLPHAAGAGVVPHPARRLSRRARSAFRRIWGAYIAGYGFNAVVPARGGDVIRLFLTKTSVPNSSYPAVAVVVLRRADLRPDDGDPDPRSSRSRQGVFPKPPDFSKLPAFDLAFFASHPRFTLFLLTVLAIAVLVGLRAAVGARAGVLGARAPGR